MKNSMVENIYMISIASIEKGGRPIRKRPHYMMLRPYPWLKYRYNEREEWRYLSCYEMIKH